MRIDEISDGIVASIEAQLGSSVRFLPRTFTRVIAKSVAAVVVTLYKYGSFIALQQFIRTASDQEITYNGKTVVPLTEYGRQIGVGDPKSATAFEGVGKSVTLAGAGVFTIPIGTTLTGDSNGVTYILTKDIRVNTALTSEFKAVQDPDGGNGLGEIGNLSVNDTLTLVQPSGGVTQLVVASTLVTGVEGETTEEYRARVLDRYQKRPQGGAYSDYEQWGESVEGIINIYPYKSANPGKVDVYCESNIAPDGIPTLDQLQDVRDAIDLDESGIASRRPVSALVNTFEIVRTGFDVTVTGLIVDDAENVKASLSQAVDEYMRAREPYIDGLTVPPRQDRLTRSGVSGVIDDIVSANGGTFQNVTLSNNTATFESYTLGQGQKAKLSTFTAS